MTQKEKDIVFEWFLENTNINNKSKLIFNNDIVNINDNLILNEDIKILPYKLGMINGSFTALNSNLHSFNNFPTTIRGYLDARNNSFSNWNGWNVENVGKDIFLSSHKSFLRNLDGLYHTKFGIFHLDNVFSNGIPKEYLPYLNISQIPNANRLYMKDLNILKEANLLIDLKDLSCEDYLNKYDLNFNDSLSQDNSFEMDM